MAADAGLEGEEVEVPVTEMMSYLQLEQLPGLFFFGVFQHVFLFQDLAFFLCVELFFWFQEMFHKISKRVIC